MNALGTQPLLMQMARFPQPGSVKTRLQPQLSDSEACAVHVELLQHTALCLLASELGEVELWIDSDRSHKAINDVLARGVGGPRLQCEGDLGQRMYGALEDGLMRAPKVLLVGSDCPALTSAYLRSALVALDEVDVVLGAAEDGGFVLLACKALRSGMFDDIHWGTDTVLRDTLERLSSHSLSYALLPELYDVDTPCDLDRWRRSQPANPFA